MDRDAGYRLLRLSSRAGRKEIHHAYKQESRSLKLRLLGAQRPEEIALLRNNLRTLVDARTAATGEPLPEAPRPGVSGSRVLELLERTSISALKPQHARGFFRIPEGAGEGLVRDVYREYSRALVRRFARAADREEIARVRRARAKLRTIRNFALVR